MFFSRNCKIDKPAVFSALGYGENQPDKQTELRLNEVSEAAERAAAPRWNYVRIQLEKGNTLLPGGLVLPGQDILAHLAGCDACYLLVLTLGTGVERDIRMAEATDMAGAVLLDVSASVLVEQYADVAEDTLRALAAKDGLYVTGRFSPGYGDLPISLQQDLLNLTDAQRKIGLTVNENHILLPRKSVTAIMGIAPQPVEGRLAGCLHCPLREKCDFHLNGGRGLCGKGQKKDRAGGAQ